MTTFRYRSSDLELFPDDGKRREIIDGELYVSRIPPIDHQIMCAEVAGALDVWNKASGLGFVILSPGLVFSDDNDVAPDLVWVTKERLKVIIDGGGHLSAAPELVVEVLSPGTANERRDREIKLDLYSRHGVREYWIVDWDDREIAVYRRSDAALWLVANLLTDRVLDSPLLPGFSLPLNDLFARLPDF
jgi:Uma2 family endonuclease